MPTAYAAKRTKVQSHYHCRVHNYMNLPKYGKIVTNRGCLADILGSHLVFGITLCPVEFPLLLLSVSFNCGAHGSSCSI